MLTFGILGLVALYVLFHGTNKQQQAEATLTKYWARHPHHTSTGAVADTSHKRTTTSELVTNEVPQTYWGPPMGGGSTGSDGMYDDNIEKRPMTGGGTLEPLGEESVTFIKKKP